MNFNYDFDKEDMRTVLNEFPKQIEESKKLTEDISLEHQFNHVYILGMGGSALPGDLLKCYIDPKTIPITVIKNYNIPKTIDKNSLVFAISYSGNTEETINSYREAIKTGAKIVSISAGGKLKELAKMNNNIHISVNQGIQPRQAIAYLFFIVLYILMNSKIIEDKSKEIQDTIETLKKDLYEENAKNLAIKIQNKIPIIYSSENMSIIAEKWKISFNENAKTPAFFNVFPELNHNEMNGFINVFGDYFIIIIKDEDDHPRIKKRMKVFKDLIKEKDKIGRAHV